MHKRQALDFQLLHIDCEVMDRQRVHDRGSRSVQTLEKAWKKLQSILPELPPVVFVSLDVAGRRRRRGHFSGSSWRYRKAKSAHEIGISPELFASAREVLATIVHEAAHALLYQRTGSPGCGAGGYYHLSEFRDCCRDELGLECSFRNTRYGFADTRWGKVGIPPRYRSILAMLKRELPWGTSTQYRPSRICPKKVPESGHIRLRCPCQRSVYASKNVITKGSICCGLCGGKFR
jgi:hypothetical protein